MRIDFNDERIKPLAADMARIAAAYFTAYGVEKTYEGAYEKLKSFVRENSNGKESNEILAEKLGAILPDFAEFAAAVLENFR